MRDFAGKTKAGIGIGSNLKDLKKAFGNPDSEKDKGPQGTFVRYNRLGLWFTLSRDKVVEFKVLRPKG